MNIVELVNLYMMEIIILFLVITTALIVLVVVLLIKVKNLEKRYKYFINIEEKDENISLQEILIKSIEDNKEIKSKYNNILKYVKDLDKNIQKSTQKVGVVRYNPFDEVGGNLCFSVALLDSNDDGVVLTGIHSRTGSFTYAKPVELGISPYFLSEEEIEAIKMARDSAYKSIKENIDLDPMQPKKLKVKIRPKRKKYIREEKNKQEAQYSTEEDLEIKEMDQPEITEVEAMIQEESLENTAEAEDTKDLETTETEEIQPLEKEETAD